jgi:hypothetical protein
MVIRTFGGFGAVPERIASIDGQAQFICHREHRAHRENNQLVDSVLSVTSVANL